MKTITITIFFIGYFIHQSVAQNTSSTAFENQVRDILLSKEMSADERATLLTEMMRDSLQLNPEQYKSVLTINQRSAKKVDDAVKSSGNSTFSLATKLRSIQKERDKAIKIILSVDQNTKYEALKKDIKTAFKQKVKGSSKESRQEMIQQFK